MYSITTTKGFIIGSRPYGEADSVLTIFTRDLGLIVATARGIRLEKSKLRYSAQLYSLGNFSFVKGKEYWRLTSAAKDFSLAQLKTESKKDIAVNIAGVDLSARLALLLNRFLHGQEPHQQLFDCLENCLEYAHKIKINDYLPTLESLTVARILFWLGYIGDDAEIGADIKSVELSDNLLESLKTKRVLINKHINKALNESHL